MRSWKTTGKGVIIFVLLLILILMGIIRPGRTTTSNEFQDRIDYILRTTEPPLNDSLPYYAYKKSYDSLKRIVSENNLANSDGSGFGFWGIGTSKHEQSKPEYRLYVNYYKIPQGSVFYTRNGKNYLLYSDWNKKVHDSLIETPLRMIERKQENSWTVYYPLSRTALITINVLIIIFMVLLVVLTLYVFLSIPLKVLYNIAKGNAFNDENIGSLHFLAYVLIAFGLLMGLLPILVHLYFMNRLPSVINFSFYDAFMSGWAAIVSGLIVLLLAKAFQRGYQLQQDQELTV